MQAKYQVSMHMACDAEQNAASHRAKTRDVGSGSMNETAHAVACGKAPAALRQERVAVNGM